MLEKYYLVDTAQYFLNVFHNIRYKCSSNVIRILTKLIRYKTFIEHSSNILAGMFVICYLVDTAQYFLNVFHNIRYECSSSVIQTTHETYSTKTFIKRFEGMLVKYFIVDTPQHFPNVFLRNVLQMFP